MIKLLFSCGPFSNLEIDGIQSVAQAKQAYDECVSLFGEPKEATKKSFGGGGQRKPDVPKDQQKGAPQGQVMQEGVQCGHCGQGLKLSSKGNAYCKCWYEAKQAMPPMAQGPQPTGF